MKKLIFLTLIVLSFTTKAQENVFFDCPRFEQVSKTIVTEDKIWKTCGKLKTNLKFIGDTIVDNLKYMRLYERKYYDKAFYHYWKYTGIIMREDAGKVYVYAEPIYGYNNNNFFTDYFSNYYYRELLFYDFTLNVGDSILLFYEETHRVVSKVDSVETHCKQAKKLKRIFFEDCPHFAWIEGVGDTRDLFQGNGNKYSNSCSVACAHNGINFFNDIYTCTWYSSPTDIINNNLNIKIYPTIVNDILIVDIDNNIDVSVNIYNTQGSLFLSEDICQSGSINCLQLPSGTYIVQIKDKDGFIIKTERIIKKRNIKI